MVFLFLLNPNILRDLFNFRQKLLKPTLFQYYGYKKSDPMLIMNGWKNSNEFLNQLYFSSIYIYRMHRTNVWNFGFLSVACITCWRNGNFWTKSKVRFSFVLSKSLFRKLLLRVDTIDINPMQIFRILSHLKSCHAFYLSV